MEGTAAYKRIVLKLSGEALMGSQPFGIDESVVTKVADEIKSVTELGVQIVALRSAGFNHVDLDAAHHLDLTVVRVPAYSPT